jgi:hypothetical protein
MTAETLPDIDLSQVDDDAHLYSLAQPPHKPKIRIQRR